MIELLPVLVRQWAEPTPLSLLFGILVCWGIILLFAWLGRND